MINNNTACMMHYKLSKYISRFHVCSTLGNYFKRDSSHGLRKSRWDGLMLGIIVIFHLLIFIAYCIVHGSVKLKIDQMILFRRRKLIVQTLILNNAIFIVVKIWKSILVVKIISLFYYTSVFHCMHNIFILKRVTCYVLRT